MHAYKFRILSEDNEDFLMDIEVKASQTFLDLHNAIKQFCNITSNELASFYLCDDKWRKKTEIMLIDMNVKEDDKEAKPSMLMEQAVFSKIIDNPHQKLMYVYDYFKMHTFYIELIQIKPSSNTITYPFLAKKEGDLQLNQTTNLMDLINDEDDIPELLNDDTESFFGDETDPDELDNFSTDTFYDDQDKY